MSRDCRLGSQGKSRKEYKEGQRETRLGLESIISQTCIERFLSKRETT
ncbi:hypothetical protein C347_05332 [Cryptococcus neoformans AD2-60a]|uniref:Uncharacterized protein n=1 Tax=Cryptococcus neoformans Tu259-1 TaxID=1230072 RepID=A0A854QBT3_CRYNE|nr:hypothetical protein C347_05332 [Cryptococcus neoformans var. grubii AD2-60a]OWZ35158.1 hypothetical protein C353_05182 [Cryptococcus neoformans var. grubii AD1-83a]OWZ51778.1 hypothetical protein C368_05442 [Cryptococcus neoformans var. grubii 125.91]OXC82736.1 hypothetical protein C344_05009 [Cryptococcus neoformans var. grubii AD1-7a]OXG15194.1 hypothetical protein C361_05500 [Cryptococcus neoformans var. grubii Tu259-1]OXG36387.1 hypothetical protein C359_05153 [Cryptococcus neoformans 